MIFNLAYFSTWLKVFPWYIHRPDALRFVLELLPLNGIILLLGTLLLFFEKEVSLVKKLLPLFVLMVFTYVLLFANFDDSVTAYIGLGISGSYFIQLISLIREREK